MKQYGWRNATQLTTLMMEYINMIGTRFIQSFQQLYEWFWIENRVQNNYLNVIKIKIFYPDK